MNTTADLVTNTAAPVSDTEEDLELAARSGWRSFAERLQEVLRKILAEVAVRASSPGEFVHCLEGSAVIASSTGSGQLIFDEPVFFGKVPGTLKVWVEDLGLRVAAIGPSKLVGQTFKITIAEDKPELVFQAYQDQAWGRVQISWDQAGLSRETVSKLIVTIEPSK